MPESQYNLKPLIIKSQLILHPYMDNHPVYQDRLAFYQIMCLETFLAFF